jgi:ABC-type microcin C transport system duplicated ATPase subunit YejF
MGREGVMANVRTTGVAARSAGSESVLDVRDLSVRFDGAPAGVNVVDNVSFSVGRGRTLCIVGESGCGKSVTALSLMGLLPTPPARIVSGTATFDGRNLLDLPERERADLRGDRIAMIFQEPMTSLNPAFTIGDQIAEGIIRHRNVSRAEATERALDMLARCAFQRPRSA